MTLVTSSDQKGEQTYQGFFFFLYSRKGEIFQIQKSYICFVIFLAIL